MDKKWFSEASNQERKQFVRRMFNDISPTYDLLNRVMTFGIDLRWRKKSIRKLLENLSGKNFTFLDMACGTGDMTETLLRVCPDASVVMADFAERMLQASKQRKFFQRFESQISLCQADGEVLPFRDNSFDGITIAFGLRNIPDPSAAIEEFYRVLMPEGKLVILEISESPYRWFDQLYRLYFHHFVPFVGRLISGHKNAYSYLPRSVENFIKPHELIRIMEEKGFTKIHAEPLTLGTVHLYTGIK